MAILGPAQLPVILKLNSDPLKMHVLSTLGHPVVNVELVEPQLEQAIKSVGDFIAQYCPHEQQYAYFYTKPLVSTYPLPPDAYMIQEVSWDPSISRIFDVFGVENYLINFVNVSGGMQNILMDYFLLQQYRKFSQRILATEGQWEVGGDQKIRLFPTPRGAFPVVVQYIPVITRFKTPESREIIKRMLVAEGKIILGNIRSKFGGIPTPDGGTLNLNGDSLRTEGEAEKKQVLEDAINLSGPMPIMMM